MALPGNVTTVVVLGTFLTPEGNPSTGTITFTPSRWLNNPGADVAIPNSAVTKTLGTAGNFSVTLPVTDDSDLNPANWYYTVTEIIDGVSQSYDILLPGSAATNGTVYLPDITPAAALGPEFASIQGPAGSAATITVGTVTSGTAGGAPSVTNTGTSSAAILDFVLIPGNTGPQGATGATGAQGPAATIEVGTVTSGTAGGTPSVTNSGTSGSAVFDFVLIPGDTGPQGATGPQGSAATITVGTVTTVAYGGTASVTNSGTSGSAVLDFVLVTGPQGDLAGLTANDPIDYTSNTFSLMYGAGLGTATGGTLVADLSDATPAALGTAGAAGTATKISRADHVHARPTAGEIGAVGTATAITAGTALAGGGDLSTSRTLDVVLSDATPAAVGTPSAGTATSPSRADHVHEGTTLSSATPAALGTAAAGTATAASRGDHVHATPSASDVGAVANSLVQNSKGAVPVGTGSAVAALSPGSNGQTLVADSSQTNGLRYVDGTLARNAVTNGNLAVWQRGTSVAAATSVVYGADRWAFFRDDLTTGATMTRQTDTPTGFRYCARVARDSGNTATSAIRMAQAFETVDSIPFAGRSVTLSFWARSGANFSGASSNMAVVLGTGTGTDQATDTYRFGGWTGQATAISQNQAITSTWTRYSFTVTLGATVTQLMVSLGFTPVGTAGANDWFEVTGVQLETGPVATPFEFEPFEATLRKCQRYYQKSYNVDVNPGTSTDAGCIHLQTQATNSYHGMPMARFAPTMRANPTVTVYSSTGASGKIRNSTAGTDVNGAAADSGMSGAYIYVNNSSIAGGVDLKAHWVAEIEL